MSFWRQETPKILKIKSIIFVNLVVDEIFTVLLLTTQIKFLLIKPTEPWDSIFF